ncbi:cutinase family protein [Mycolicibacterium sp. 22603]|uniref:cutinase family protein n=1 Tax=Mycolicibacterium sp. 22603 TaxID=3453950 RepID=UPI003F847E23
MSSRSLPAKHRARKFVATVAAVVAAAGGFVASVAVTPAGQLPAASAEPCAPVELIFARGRGEAPGIGRIGDALVGALNARLPQPVGVYAVNYPADFEVPVGANDISDRIQYMAGACPNTRLIVGGYSLGAASAALALSATQSGLGFDRPLPPEMAGHVAAVVLVANITRRMVGNEIGPPYRERTINVCVPTDPVCGDSLPTGFEDLQNVWPNHWQDAYIGSGLIEQAADFAAARVR